MDGLERAAHKVFRIKYHFVFCIKCHVTAKTP
jgi:hypothetical protein